MKELKNTTLTKQPHLKEAILNLSEKEKDKLLVRLINKDKKLIEQLHYLLLEDENDLIQRINEAKNDLSLVFDRMRSGLNRTKQHYKHRELTAYLKSASGIVNEHASVTKNKESELDLRLVIFEETIKNYHPLYLNEANGYKADMHFSYQISRLKSILSLYDKLHDDLKYEYRDRIQFVLDFVERSVLKDYALAAGINYLAFE